MERSFESDQPEQHPLDLTKEIRRLDEYQCDGGSFGDIFKCLYDSPLGPIEVAVKALRFSLAQSQDNEERTLELSLRRELGIWRRLDHPNIVPFLGIAFGFGPHTSLVSVWMCNGTLQSFLDVRGDSLVITDRFHLLEDVASGIQYLHAFPMIHGDLTSNNILIDEHFRACLVDFGFASVVGDLPEGLTYLQRSTQRPGATRWAAPERFKIDDFRPTTKSDIYSLGCIMLQVLSGRVPWSEIKDSMVVALKLLRGENPGRPSTPVIEDEHWALIQQCWLPVEKRLSAEDVVHRISNISFSIENPSQPGPPQTSGTHSWCLMCQKAPKARDSHFCSRTCSGAATHRAPLLLEAPRGHVTFERIANNFVTSWRRTRTPSPEVKKVYKIIQKQVYAANYDKYRARVGPNGSRSSGRGNELHRWHGTSRDCDIGRGGDVTPCSSKSCALCQIILSTFDAAWYPGGAIHSSITSDKADKHSKSPGQYPSKAMFLVNVAAGRIMKVTRSEFHVSGGIPRGYDSVGVLRSRDGKSVIEDLIVYTGDAVRPSYLVIYG